MMLNKSVLSWLRRVIALTLLAMAPGLVVGEAEQTRTRGSSRLIPPWRMFGLPRSITAWKVQSQEAHNMTIGVAPVLPRNKASSLHLVDEDLAQGELRGIISLGMAKDESELNYYNIYWGTGNKKLAGENALIQQLPKQGHNLLYKFGDPSGEEIPHELGWTPEMDHHIPSGATHILVFTSNAAGEMSDGLSTEILDTAEIPKRATIPDTNRTSSTVGLLDGLSQKVSETTDNTAAKDGSELTPWEDTASLAIEEKALAIVQSELEPSVLSDLEKEVVENTIQQVIDEAVEAEVAKRDTATQLQDSDDATRSQVLETISSDDIADEVIRRARKEEARRRAETMAKIKEAEDQLAWKHADEGVVEKKLVADDTLRVIQTDEEKSAVSAVEDELAAQNEEQVQARVLEEQAQIWGPGVERAQGLRGRPGQRGPYLPAV